VLEILVSLRRAKGVGAVGNPENGIKKTGDILVAKKMPCVWGTEERKNFLITVLDDPSLEAKMGDKKSLSYPYAVTEADENGIQHVVNRSSFRVSLAHFPDVSGWNKIVEHGATPPYGTILPHGKPNLEVSDLLEDASPRKRA